MFRTIKLALKTVLVDYCNAANNIKPKREPIDLTGQYCDHRTDSEIQRDREEEDIEFWRERD